MKKNEKRVVPPLRIPPCLSKVWNKGGFLTLYALIVQIRTMTKNKIWIKNIVSSWRNIFRKIRFVKMLGFCYIWGFQGNPLCKYKGNSLEILKYQKKSQHFHKNIFPKNISPRRNNIFHPNFIFRHHTYLYYPKITKHLVTGSRRRYGEGISPQIPSRWRNAWLLQRRLQIHPPDQSVFFWDLDWPWPNNSRGTSRFLIIFPDFRQFPASKYRLFVWIREGGGEGQGVKKQR